MVILALHLALGLLYSVIVPPWEAHDEWAHYKFVEYVARQRALPSPDQRLTHEYAFDEAGQPPLYYVIAALPVSLVDTDDEIKPDVNPYFDLGTGAGGVNAAVHHPEQERFPWRGTILALHLARGVSLLISLVGLIAIYRLGRLLAPERPWPALTALAIAAFSPQYLFISSVVTNDVLIAALGCVIAWLGAKVVLEGLRPGTALALALATGLALITKLSAVALLPFVLLAFIAGAVRALRRGGNRAKPRTLLAVWLTVAAPLIGGLALGVLWVVRNWRLTGELLPRDPWLAYRFVERWFGQAGDIKPVPWAALPSALRYGFRTFWASFGWGNLQAPAWVYWFFTALCLIGLVGVIYWLAQSPEGDLRRARPRDRKVAVGLLALLIASVLALATYRDFDYGSGLIRGRYLLPALGAVATLIALGLDTLADRLFILFSGQAAGLESSLARLPAPAMPVGPGAQPGRAGGLLLAADDRLTLKRAGAQPRVRNLAPPEVGGPGGLQQALFLTLAAVLALTNVLLPLRVIAPAYRPARVAQADLLPGEQPLHARFGDAAELVAYELWPETVHPGDGLGVTLLWRVLTPLDRNYTVGVHLLGEARVKVGQTNVYPGRGNYATTLWRSGDLFRETCWVTVQEPISRPIMGRVKVALFLDDASQAHLPVTDPQGHDLGEAVEFGRFKLAPAAMSEAAAQTPGLQGPVQGPAHFSGAALGETIRLSAFAWQAGRTPPIAGDTITVTLTWDALGRPPADYTVFVHLDGPAGPAAFGDGPPAEDTYPTGLWDRGEQIVDRHPVRLPEEMPAGDYRLIVGLYDAVGVRVAAFDPDGARLTADQVFLERIRVTRLERRGFLPILMGDPVSR
jgi:4-amino-4-deoxy-L-arabinose transferase-like glycosyltransferase